MIETICRDCGTRYQVGTDHTCPAKKSSGRKLDTIRLKAIDDNEPSSHSTKVEPVVASRQPLNRMEGSGSAPRFDKVAYQRDYMRRRRAEQKAKAEIMKQRTVDA